MNRLSQGHPVRAYRMVARAEAAEATARAIIAAARRLFSELPYDEVSLPAVAAAAGVTVQTLLRRFGSKDGLFAAAARERSRRSAPNARRDPAATCRISSSTTNAGATNNCN